MVSITSLGGLDSRAMRRGGRPHRPCTRTTIWSSKRMSISRAVSPPGARSASATRSAASCRAPCGQAGDSTRVPFSSVSTVRSGSETSTSESCAPSWSSLSLESAASTPARGPPRRCARACRPASGRKRGPAIIGTSASTPSASGGSSTPAGIDLPRHAVLDQHHRRALGDADVQPTRPACAPARRRCAARAAAAWRARAKSSREEILPDREPGRCGRVIGVEIVQAFDLDVLDHRPRRAACVPRQVREHPDRASMTSRMRTMRNGEPPRGRRARAPAAAPSLVAGSSRPRYRRHLFGRTRARAGPRSSSRIRSPSFHTSPAPSVITTSPLRASRRPPRPPSPRGPARTPA